MFANTSWGPSVGDTYGFELLNKAFSCWLVPSVQSKTIETSLFPSGSWSPSSFSGIRNNQFSGLWVQVCFQNWLLLLATKCQYLGNTSKANKICSMFPASIYIAVTCSCCCIPYLICKVFKHGTSTSHILFLLQYKCSVLLSSISVCTVSVYRKQNSNRDFIR